MNAKKHTPLSLHGLRLLFPPLATLGILFLTEWIARGSLTGETFTQYIFPHAEAYLLAWAMLFLSWLAVDWLTRFAPLATLLAAVLGCAPAAVNFYTLQLRGEPFLPWDLMQVSEAAGVAAAAGIHIQTSMVVSIVIIVLLVVVSFFLYCQCGSYLRPALWRVPAACRDTGHWHCAGCLDAGSLLPLLWCHHQLSDQSDQSGDLQAGGVFRGGCQRDPG